eukprot:6672009-Prymnesium_polylepis.1
MGPSPRLQVAAVRLMSGRGGIRWGSGPVTPPQALCAASSVVCRLKRCLAVRPSEPRRKPNALTHTTRSDRLLPSPVPFFVLSQPDVTPPSLRSRAFRVVGRRITRDFFAAAGYCEDEGEPPPGAVVTFDAFFRKFGLTKPKVRSPDQLGRSYSSR